MIYRYSAVDRDGLCITGICRAPHVGALEARLAYRQQDLLRAKPVPFWQRHLSRPLTRPALIAFCLQLRHLLQAGIPLMDALHDLQDGNDNAGQRALLVELSESIAQGKTLSEAMQAADPAFEPMFIQLIAAGEESGELPDILARLADSLRWQDDLARQTGKALIYPAFTTLIIACVTLFLMLSLVPQLKLFVVRMGQSLPLHSQLLFGISDLLIGHALWLFPALLITGAGLFGWLGSERGRPWRDQGLLHIPLIGEVIRQLQVARFAGTLALLYGAGIPLLTALRSTAKTASNLSFETAIETCTEQLESGSSLASAISAQPLFPRLLARMVQTGECSGQLEETLNHVAGHYQATVRDSVGRLQVMVEPILTVTMGLLLGWIMLAVIGPIYDIISRIQP